MFSRRPVLVAFSALPLAALPPTEVGAQVARFDVSSEVFVNSEIEEYLRLVQLRGKSPHHPWSIRGFSAGEVERLLPPDSLHPWVGRYDLRRSEASADREIVRVPPTVQLYYNSAFPYGYNDGAVWQGRGVTAAVAGGVAVRKGAFSLTLAPQVFVAQNADFRLRPNGLTGERAFADASAPEVIDRPQRFGDGAYLRVDPGQSTLRADLRGVAVGISTANQHWGPVVANPLILGNNAAGFPHAFVGSSRPFNVGIGRLHGRVVWGTLSQTAHSPLQGDSSRRFMSGVVATFMPRGLTGLEVGGARFFHTISHNFQGGDLLKPFQGILKEGIGQVVDGDDRSDADNQIASAFFRWTLQGSGLEVYGEYAREDHSFDLRDFVLEPDHSRGFVLGFQKVLGSADHRWTVLRGEWLDAQISHIVLARSQGYFYQHTVVRQGHTQRGQVLGSAAAFGGQAAVLGVDRFHGGGRWGVEYRRALQGETVVDSGRHWDVTHGLQVDAVLFRRSADLRVGATGVYNQNRDFREDAFNVNVTVGATVRF